MVWFFGFFNFIHWRVDLFGFFAVLGWGLFWWFNELKMLA